MDYGIWTLLPIVVVVAVALKSRRALEPLILGTLLTYIIVDGLFFPIGWMDAFFRVATDQSHQWADCDLGHGDSDLCGRLSEYHDPEHLHAQAH